MRLCARNMRSIGPCGSPDGATRSCGVAAKISSGTSLPSSAWPARATKTMGSRTSGRRTRCPARSPRHTPANRSISPRSSIGPAVRPSAVRRATSSSGRSRASARASGSRSPIATLVEMPITSLRPKENGSSVEPRAVPASRRTVSTRGHIAAARGVGCIPPATLTKRGSPTTSRKRASAWLVAGWLSASASAARPTCRCCHMAAKTVRRFRSSRRGGAIDAGLPSTDALPFGLMASRPLIPLAS